VKISRFHEPEIFSLPGIIVSIESKNGKERTLQFPLKKYRKNNFSDF
jgi:hypothetical protein